MLRLSFSEDYQFFKVLFPQISLRFYFFYLKKNFIYERTREQTQAEGGVEGEGERILSSFCTEHTEPNIGLSLTTGRSQPEPKPTVDGSTDWATHIPPKTIFIIILKYYLPFHYVNI